MMSTGQVDTEAPRSGGFDNFSPDSNGLETVPYSKGFSCLAITNLPLLPALR